MGKMVRFLCPGGGEVAGYLASARNPRAGVVVIQEWWGLNDQIRGVADRFAGDGFTALAPDLYAGRVTREPDEANHLMEGLDWVGATMIDVRGAARYLRQFVKKVGVVGFCLGGALTLIAAARLTEFAAGVCFYGIPPKEQADPAQIRIPLQGHFAKHDKWCVPSMVDDLEMMLRATGAFYEFHRYDADHAFFNDQLPEQAQIDKYDADAAALSWERTLQFFKAHLA